MLCPGCGNDCTDPLDCTCPSSGRLFTRDEELALCGIFLLMPAAFLLTVYLINR